MLISIWRLSSTIVAWMYILLSSHECTFSYRRMKIWECRHTCADDMSSENEHVFMCRRYVFGEWRCLHVPTICLRRMKMSSCADDMSSFIENEDIRYTSFILNEWCISSKTRYVCVDILRRHDMSVTSKTQYVCVDNTICLCLWHRRHDMSVTWKTRYVWDDILRRHDMSVTSTTRYVCVCDIDNTICLCLHSPKTRYVCDIEDTICLWHRRHDRSVSTYRVFDVYDMSSFSEDKICLCRHSPKTRYVCVDILRRHDMSVSTFSEDTICLCRRYVCADDMSVSTIYINLFMNENSF